jgi:hypothetical protein
VIIKQRKRECRRGITVDAGATQAPSANLNAR